MERFLIGFYDFFKQKVPKGKEAEQTQKAFHDVIVDSDEVVTIENFAKMAQWFGPMKGLSIIKRVVDLHMKPWFHGNLSSIQAEDLLGEKAKGTFLIRFSASNPGSYAISALNEDGIVKHYKVWHQAGGGYTFGKEEFKTLDHLIDDRSELLHLKYPCPKGERYSDSNFWTTHTVDEEENKTVVSLKKLCFRFIYRNNQLFPNIRQVMPFDLLEEYYCTIVDSITSDESGRDMWKANFLGRDSVTWAEFSEALYKFLGVKLKDEQDDIVARTMMHAIVKDICDNGEDLITIETYSKMMEWFGPMGSTLRQKVLEIVSKSWFHGNLSHIQAEKLIQRNSNAKKGTFLIRFSSKNRGYFTITVVGRKRSLLHYRVYYNRAKLEYVMGRRVFSTLDEIITTYHRELCLRYPCPGSKFQILQSNHRLSDGYLSD